MFHLDVSLQPGSPSDPDFLPYSTTCSDQARAAAEQRTHWGNVDGVNICAGSFTNFEFDKKVKKGFNKEFKESIMIVQDPLIKLYYVWDFIFQKEVISTFIMLLSYG